MKNKLLAFASILAIILSSISTSFADNPIVQTVYTADPAPMVYNNTCYVYTGHDEDTLVNNFFTMNDWRCYSSTDMVNWTDHGSPLSYKTFSWTKGDAWAGQVIERNGKFYYYVPMTQKNGGMAIGVGVSTKPEGPFTDAIGKPLVTTGTGDIDPTVFIDDDGQAYLYWGNPNLWYVKLNKDMISYTGTPTKINLTTASFGVRSNTDRPTQYEEGPWFYKRGSLYYMVFAAGPVSEHIAYSTSTGPTGPWTFKGTIMATQGASFTNHSGICDYKGNTYFFYHNGALTGGSGYHRSVCIEQFKYNSDGTIPSMNMSKNGPDQVGALNPFERTEAETICWESGVETENCGEGGMDVCSIENGDYIKVKGVNFGTGATSFEARVASANSGGNIEIRLDSTTGTLIGTCAVSGTGGWQTWTTKTCKVTGATGKHDVYFKFTGGSGSLFNFNWWDFISSAPIDTPTPTVTPTPTPTPAPISAFSQVEAENFNDQSGIQSETCNEGGQDVGYIENGDYAVYKNINFGNGASSFQARVSSASSGGKIELRLDSITGALVGTCSVSPTGDWQTWADAKCDVSGLKGVHDLYLKFTGDSGYLFNLNWWKFNVNTETPTPTSTPTLKPTPVVSLDLNHDGAINMADVILLATKFGSVKGNAGFVEEYDLNKDGAINIADVIMIASKFNTVV
ncbi:MAG: carbohydrate-binding protein [Bacillota bacterium]|nr:carbohydrate-binding protein [Bacillota bacterium]